MFDFIDRDTEYIFEKKKTLFFHKMIEEVANDAREEILKFPTGHEVVSPWELRRKIYVKFLKDNDTKIYPEAMVCFRIQ